MENQDSDNVSFKNYCFIHWQGAMLCVLPVIFVLAMLTNDTPPYRCLYVIVATFICLLTEIFPRAISAMFPIIGFPLLNIMISNLACSLYFKDTLVMFMISVMIACAVEFTELNIRVSIYVCHMLGSNLMRLHLLLVCIATCLSMAIPNSICVALMYPFTLGILETLSKQGVCKVYENDDPAIPKTSRIPTRIAICFYFSVAYASSMGGSATLIGSSTNLIFKQIYEKRFPDSPDKIDFKNVLLYALPPMLVYTTLMFLTMEFVYMGLFRPNSPDALLTKVSYEQSETIQRIATEDYEAIGTITLAECTISALLVAMIAMIVTRKPEFVDGWADVFNEKEIQNTSITTIIIYLAFSLPASYKFLKCWDASSAGKTPGLVTWKYINSLVAWELIFIIGSGATLAEGSKISGLGRLLGDGLVNLKNLPAPIGLFIAIIVMILCSNLTVNAAVMSVVAPGIIEMAVASKLHPLYLLMPTGIAGSMAFLMPAATAPNALVSSYANIRTMDMIYGGIGPTIVAVLTIYIFTQTWALFVYPDLMKFPDWISQLDAGVIYGDEQKIAN